MSSGSSASAVPIPIATASDSARQRWTSARLRSPEIHLESPAAVAVRPSRLSARLEDDERPAGACVLAERLIEQPGGRGLGALCELDLDPAVAEDPRAAAARLLARVVGADHDPGDRRGEDRVGARRLATLVGARLERDVHGRPGGVAAAPAAVRQRRDLGVGLAERRRGGPRRSDAVADDHRADERVRAHPAPPALGQLQRSPKVIPIAICEQRDSHLNQLTDQSIRIIRPPPR